MSSPIMSSYCDLVCSTFIRSLFLFGSSLERGFQQDDCGSRFRFCDQDGSPSGNRESFMAWFLIEGTYTAAAKKALVTKPQDRAESVRPIIEKAGGKLHHLF